MIYVDQTLVSGQEDEQASILIQLHHFSAENWASVREPTSLVVASQLIWQFAVDGFVTNDEPITIRLKDPVCSVQKCNNC